MQEIVGRMTNTLRHRGPDDEGLWSDRDAGVTLGFRRLSIIDLSPAGHQPMISHTGRYVVVFNGEVYNFERIRAELRREGRAPEFRGHSDTEVMLAAIEAWGLEEAVKRFIGMFAFALWDRQLRQLHLVRDRIGVKPLHYGTAGGAIVFGSELKALRAHPSFDREIDRDSMALLLRYNYIPAPRTIYRAAKKLPPGTIVTINSRDRLQMGDPVPYWSARTAAEQGVKDPFQGSPAEAVEQLHELLRDAVGLRMIADVPLGVFLSGGIDSSVVVALMQAQSARRVKTFTIGFGEDGYNEAVHAKEVARHLGTEHTEMYVSPSEALAVIPKLPELYDEPFSDSSQIPTHLVSMLARRQVTVALSGDGGDELFAGYTRYLIGSRAWKSVAWLPGPIRQTAAALIDAVPPRAWDQIGRLAGKGLPMRLRHPNPGSAAIKFARMLRSRRPEAMYDTLTSHWSNPNDVVIGSRRAETTLSDPSQWATLENFTQSMMYLDLVTYLPDDILVKVDRASMGVSLEAREPLLDHRLVEFAWRLPLSLKMRDGQSKWALRQVLHKYVPREMVDRPKMGFGVPIGSWLRGPLREWAEELLDERRLRQEGFFDPAPIRQKWREHLESRHDWQYYLWDVLMFQAWLEHESETSSAMSAVAQLA